MSTTKEALLPSGFELLEPYIELWAIEGAVNEQERIYFYSAAKDLVAAALTHLDQKPLEILDDNEQRLMNLVLSFVHVAQAVEVQEGNQAAHVKLREALPITQASADFLS